MRIIAGEYRGRTLGAPKGAHTRPTADRVKEALFSIIGPCEGCAVLDLFAGSGALGCEALSRGARHATFVDNDAQAIACIRANISVLGCGAQADVIRRDWADAVATEARRNSRFDLCLLDPPYSVLAGISEHIAATLRPVLAEYATVVVEGPADGPVLTLDALAVTERIDRTYGSTRVSIFRVAEGGVSA